MQSDAAEQGSGGGADRVHSDAVCANLGLGTAAQAPTGAPAAPSLGETLRLFGARPVPALFRGLGATHAVSLHEIDARNDAAGHSGAEHADRLARAGRVERCRYDVPSSLGRAVRSRARGYLAGRHCAAQAILSLTGEPALIREPLPIGALGAPVWPAGIVGSISHSPRIAVAVAAWASVTLGIGIDCERVMNDAAVEDILGRVLPEGDAIGRRGDPTARLDWRTFVTAVFSAKESVYKCLHPITGVFFDFDAVAVEWVDVARGAMALRVVESLGAGIDSGTLLTADFCVEDEHVFTSVRLPKAGVRNV